MTLLLVITAVTWCALGAIFGYTAGQRHGLAHAAQRVEAQRLAEINHLYDLYEQPAYGDD